MKPFEAVLSSNQVDRHGEVMSKGALESAAAVLNKNYVQMGVEHDPRHPPIGRFVEAWIEEQPDGVILLKGRGELFEESDKLPDSVEKFIVEREHAEGPLQISFDRTYNSDADQADIKSIANRFGSEPKQEIKKALEPLSILTIGGAFILGGIASGFFGQIGADAYIF
ncbi:MAG TPA: XkdF-like putative serine protease domain-containing protein [Verrucomicrobiae bacterium]|nr:XkdF-like putative serine protease domain-containing protein [Verrucomicrobiae bacterium]